MDVDNIRLNSPDDSFAGLAKWLTLKLSQVVLECERDGATIKFINIKWLNILERMKNPEGRCGSFRIEIQRTVPREMPIISMEPLPALQWEEKP